MPELVVVGALLLAFMNGANDNFKGHYSAVGSAPIE